MEKTEQKGIVGKIIAWFNDFSIKGLLVAILLAFIIIIVILTASNLPGFASKASSSLSAALYSIFVPANSASMTIDKQIAGSGEDFKINFKKTDPTIGGFFTVTYACDSNINLASVETTGPKKINCDTPYYLIDNETSITIRPTTLESIIHLTIDGNFENNDTQKIDKIGTVRITIKNDSIGGSIDEPEITAVPVSNNSVPNTSINSEKVLPVYYQGPDLAIRILQIGSLNSLTKQIIPQAQFNYTDMVGVKFEVRNDGDTVTSPWYFTASLPSLTTPVYNSPAQISLKPGDSIIYTLGFSNLTNQTASLLTIKADPQNIIKESNENNNVLSTTIYLINSNPNYYYNNSNTGCYINGFFTYNCNNQNLNVNCYSTPNSPEVGDRVRWYAEATGGNGDYDYDWTGTNGLNSSLQNPSKTYTSTGRKSATVTVESNGYTVSRTCSVYVD